MTKYSNKSPYLFGDYETSANTLMDREIYGPSSPQQVESEFKKPYLYNDHPESERTFTPPGGFISNPNLPNGTGGIWPQNDCEPGGNAIGGGPNICDPGLSCGQWIFRCAHKYTSFTAVGGTISGVRYGANDTITVTACWDESKAGLTIYGWQKNGEYVDVTSDKSLCITPGHNPECGNCDECMIKGLKPVITHWTHQMSVNGTQALSVTGGGGEPYRWYLTGGGSLSLSVTTDGQSNTYTAPSTNANCVNNPVIYVTDNCGISSDELKIAVNAYTDLVNAYGVGVCYYPYGSRCFAEPPNYMSCGIGMGNQNYYCSGVASNFLKCNESGYSTSGITCSQCCGFTECDSCAGFGPPCTIQVLPTGSGYGVTVDVRTDEMKTAGCCPESLL
jgi:hypothetical protein